MEELFQQTWLDHVLHYGLLVGAVFQLICIAAIVVLPPRPEEESEEDTDGDSGGETKDDHSPTGNKNGQQFPVSTKKKGKGARKRR